MDAEPDGVELAPLPLELRPWLSRSELEVEIAVLHGRLDAEAQRHAHERAVMFAEIFRLTALVFWRSNPEKLDRDVHPRTEQRRRANPPDALKWFLRRMAEGKKIEPRYLREVSKPKK